MIVKFEPRRSVPVPVLILAGMVILGLFLGFWGLRKNLPYIEEADENIFVVRAVRMAANGDLNPEWFGHPGSTTFYPLMAIFHTWYAVTENGSFLSANTGLQQDFDQNMADYYLLGRILSVIYGAVSLVVTYLLGKRLFGQRIGLIATCLLLTNAVYWYYAQIVRTDTSSLFWGVLSLWLLDRAYTNPSARNYLFAGLSIGLSIASRYFMVTLMVVLFWLWTANFRHADGRQGRKRLVVNGLLALLAVAAAFALTTPYFFLDHTTALANLLKENRSEHLGADGLLPWGNLWWYITVAIPANITWLQVLLAFNGMILVLAARKLRQVVLVIYCVLFLIVISIPALHWSRWVAQLLPVFGLFSALTLQKLASAISRKRDWPDTQTRLVLITLVAVVSIGPFYQTMLHNVRQSNPSTRVLARLWMVENLPPGSKIGYENYSAPLEGTPFDIAFIDPLSSGGSLDDFKAAGFDYLVASSGIYARYQAERERYQQQVSFYNTLFTKGLLLQEFVPSSTRAGPVVDIFKLPN